MHSCMYVIYTHIHKNLSIIAHAQHRIQAIQHRMHIDLEAHADGLGRGHVVVLCAAPRCHRCYPVKRRQVW